jgi:hypothetical protein
MFFKNVSIEVFTILIVSVIPAMFAIGLLRIISYIYSHELK